MRHSFLLRGKTRCPVILLIASAQLDDDLGEFELVLMAYRSALAISGLHRNHSFLECICFSVLLL